MSIFCTSFPPDLRPAGPPGMEIWSNPLILNLSQFQEADRHGTGSQRSLSETGRAGRDLAADPKTGGELFFSNISRQLTRLKLGGRQTCVRTYLTPGIGARREQTTNNCKHYLSNRTWSELAIMSLTNTCRRVVNRINMSSLVSQEPTLASIPESPTMTDEHRNM